MRRGKRPQRCRQGADFKPPVRDLALRELSGIDVCDEIKAISVNVCDIRTPPRIDKLAMRYVILCFGLRRGNTKSSKF